MKKLPRVSVYIDGANMFYAQQKMGWFIDWQKVRYYFLNKYQVGSIKYYVGIKNNDSKMQNFLNKLSKQKIVLMTKPLKKIRSDISNIRFNKGTKYFYKANFDVEMAIDIILDLDKYDSIVLFSGDSDFEYLIKVLHLKTKKVIICSTGRSLSRELKIAADRCLLLGDLRKEIEYKKDPRPEGRGSVIHDNNSKK